MRNVSSSNSPTDAADASLRAYFRGETYKRRVRREQREHAKVEAAEAARAISAYFAEGTYSHAGALAELVSR